MSKLTDWCRETAAKYRSRHASVTWTPPRYSGEREREEPRALCLYIGDWDCRVYDAAHIDFAPLKWAIARLPDHMDGYRIKWPLDESGFDARADFLEAFADRWEE